MVQYQYAAVYMRTGFMNRYLEDHRTTIDTYAKKGWRFVAAIPTKLVGYGAINRIDLVFEKEVDSP